MTKIALHGYLKVVTQSINKGHQNPAKVSFNTKLI